MPINDIKENVLIVDDTPSIVAFVQSLLEGKGFCVSTATNGNEAILTANETRPDLILLDIMMPDIDGYAICALLKANDKTKDIPIIFMSALNSSFDKIKAFKAGAVDYITKPIQTEELLVRVKTHLTISKLNRELLIVNRGLEEKVKERTQTLENINQRMKNLNTQLEQAVLKYKEAKEKVELAEKTKNEFLANISHEIYTPMNAIIGFTDLVKENTEEERRNEYLAYIKSNAIKLLSIFSNILDFSQALTGESSPNFQQTDISTILESVAKKNSAEAIAKGLDIVINNENKVGFSVETDSDMLCKILNNLVSNSLKFSSKGVVEIGSSNDAQTVVFYVKDSGIGINPELYDKIYMPFEHGENTYTKTYGGTGIGLALVKKYVSALNGDIWFDSSPGVGTIFYVSLPIDNQKSKTIKKYEDIKIIVGEDEDVSFILLNEVLQPMGFNILRAKTGKELLEVFKNNPETVMVISNLTLPGISGTEVMKIIKKINPQVNTIAQISYFSAQDRRDYSFSGCDSFIDKPVNPQQIEEIIEKYIHITK